MATIEPHWPHLYSDASSQSKGEWSFTSYITLRQEQQSAQVVAFGSSISFTLLIAADLFIVALILWYSFIGLLLC